MSDLAERVGGTVRKLRKARSVTQAGLAEQAGLSTEEVSRIERGEKGPRFGTLERLAVALGVDAEQLFRRGSTAVMPSRRRPPSDRERQLQLLSGLLNHLDPRIAGSAIRGFIAMARALGSVPRLPRRK